MSSIFRGIHGKLFLVKLEGGIYRNGRTGSTVYKSGDYVKNCALLFVVPALVLSCGSSRQAVQLGEFSIIVTAPAHVPWRHTVTLVGP